MMRNPFRRRCCEVLIVSGDLDKPGAVVTGLAQVNGHTIDFAGTVLKDGEEPFDMRDLIEAALEVKR